MRSPETSEITVTETHRPCTIQMLSAQPGASTTVSGTFLSRNDSFLQFTASREFLSEGMVSLTVEDVLFLGEVLHCEPVSPELWKVLVEVKQVLPSLSQLMILREQLLGTESVRSRPSNPVRSEDQPEAVSPLLTCVFS